MHVWREFSAVHLGHNNSVSEQLSSKVKNGAKRRSNVGADTARILDTTCVNCVISSVHYTDEYMNKH